MPKFSQEPIRACRHLSSSNFKNSNCAKFEILRKKISLILALAACSGLNWFYTGYVLIKPVGSGTVSSRELGHRVGTAREIM